MYFPEFLFKKYKKIWKNYTKNTTVFTSKFENGPWKDFMWNFHLQLWQKSSKIVEAHLQMIIDQAEELEFYLYT